jgi:hydrogenase nickel incorporation protein HypB
MASPGAGKTSLILRTIEALAGRLRVGVIEGDVAGRVDADKVAETGTPVVQINTGGGCHLDAPQVQVALHQLPLEDLDLLFIENVGNLICPTGFALGEQINMMIANVPEGDDKPIKYPGMFTAVDALVLNKMDLMPYVDFDLDAFRTAVRALNSEAPIFEISCRTGEGIGAWVEWLVAFESMQETLEILGDPDLMADLRQADQDFAEGNTHSFEEIFGHPQPGTE